MTGWQLEMVEKRPRVRKRACHVRDENVYTDKSPGSDFDLRQRFLREAFPEAVLKVVAVQIHDAGTA